MAAFKCKMCGGDLEIVEGRTVCECEFCGTKQTVPTADNEKKTTLFNRANRLRMNAEFDRAASVYASITAEFPEEAEAYWGLCLCKYGIEYVDDPATGNKIPTCHRTLSESILDDEDFIQACENADPVAKRVYRDEAKAIDRLQQDILSIVANEAPYDVFICYKETDENGSRTEDSVLAQDIYDSLTGKGLKVFFARITLEDKLGQQYEPYIYAALHSAKVMLAVGTQFDYYDAVWVKNEWARFLDMMKTDRGKTLIPCYKGIDAYDMPREFKNLQAQDMGKLGYLQDLTRGVMKLCGKEERRNESAVAVSSRGSEVEPLLKRTEMFLQDEDWAKAEEYIDRVLDIEPECGKAYYYRLMQRYKRPDENSLFRTADDLSTDRDFIRAQRFADETLQARLSQLKTATERNLALSQLAYVLRKRAANLSRIEKEKEEIAAREAARLREEMEAAEAQRRAEQEKQEFLRQDRMYFEQNYPIVYPFMQALEGISMIGSPSAGTGFLCVDTSGNLRHIEDKTSRLDKFNLSGNAAIKKYLLGRKISHFHSYSLVTLDGTILSMKIQAESPLSITYQYKETPIWDMREPRFTWLDSDHVLHVSTFERRGVIIKPLYEIRNVKYWSENTMNITVIKTDGSIQLYSRYKNETISVDPSWTEYREWKNVREIITGKNDRYPNNHITVALDEGGNLMVAGEIYDMEIDDRWHDLEKIVRVGYTLDGKECFLAALRRDGLVLTTCSSGCRYDNVWKQTQALCQSMKNVVFGGPYYYINTDGMLQLVDPDAKKCFGHNNLNFRFFNGLQDLQAYSQRVRTMPQRLLEEAEAERSRVHGLFSGARRQALDAKIAGLQKLNSEYWSMD